MPVRIAILRQLALTSHHCADKNANFLRQAVSFASRNGRSAIYRWKTGSFGGIAGHPGPRWM